MVTYTVAIGKGGSGKTATAAELVASLTRHGRRVLVVDLDQQANITVRMGLTKGSGAQFDAYDVLTRAAELHTAAVPSPSVPGAHVIIGADALVGVGSSHPESVTVLRDDIPGLTEWDDVVIDTPPDLGIPTLTGLAAADVVIAAVETKTESYEQMRKLDQLVTERISRGLRRGQEVHWIVPCLYDKRRLLDQEVVEALQKGWPGKVTHPVRQAAAVADAYTARLPVSMFAGSSKVAADYAEALGPVIAPSIRPDFKEH